MTFAVRLLAFLVLLAPFVARAEPAAAPWGDLEIPYERSEWIVTAAKDGKGLVLLCIASDCPHYVRLYAAVVTEGGEVEEPAWRGPNPIALNAPILPFVAYELWSGCRARDAAILSAAVMFRGKLYRLVSDPGAGCNFGPQVPLARFIALLEKVRPRTIRTLTIGGIQIAYDAGRWAPSSRPGGALLTCTIRECRDLGGEQAHVGISAAPATDTSCLPTGEPAEGSVRDGGSQSFGGLTFRLWKTFSGCRAYTPAELNACAIHAGTAYRLTSGLHSGCSAGIRGVPEELFSELLAGASLAGDRPAAP